ncbi:lysophospholipid acyltransferase family protein [Raineya orbicola]|jgi:1-acyl-sn-glycerol-3-phosphate acyltransferase|uniref:Acyltransferase n=1 Tax=Raineya orbicola TaxID=2016530 RepID=A0A2N3IJW3_9BACT|nr:lysophospholipid acyltransferase family protein [Raineya orbicola]PKQ70597.1 Acyltransferase [Raineya orbicola]
MLYLFLRLVVRIALRVFFRRLEVEGKENLHLDTPLIYVANHPNTFMDPLLIASLSNKRVYFLANGSIFNRFTRSIFRLFQMLPIYRKVDKPDNPLSQAELNKMSFAKCYEHLAKKGTLLVFPEGTSVIERRLREIKTGTARIALGAEFEHNFSLNLHIVPIGLNYDDADKFRSEVFVKVGKPIRVADYQEGYNPENFAVVEKLTHDIETALSELIIITENQEQDQFIRNIETLYKNELFREFHLKRNKSEEFAIIKEIIRGVKFLESKDNDYFTRLRVQMENYLENLKTLGLKDSVFRAEKKPSLLWFLLKSFLFLLWGFPLYVIGLVFNYIPYILPSQIARFISKDVAFKAPLMMISGIFTFLIAYSISLGLIYYFTQNFLWLLIALVFMPLSGFFVLIFVAWWKKFSAELQAIQLFFRKTSLMHSLLEQRNAIFVSLKKAQKEYIQSR